MEYSYSCITFWPGHSSFVHSLARSITLELFEILSQILVYYSVYNIHLSMLINKTGSSGLLTFRIISIALCFCSHITLFFRPPLRGGSGVGGGMDILFLVWILSTSV